jgi:hypothetical protein
MSCNICHPFLSLLFSRVKMLHMFSLYVAYFLYAAAPKLFFLLPLLLACLAIIVGLSVAASRSHLHIPAYVGMAFLAFAAAMLAGHFSGATAVTGTPAGAVLSILFFLLIAVTVGSVLALFFYRHPDV